MVRFRLVFAVVIAGVCCLPLTGSSEPQGVGAGAPAAVVPHVQGKEETPRPAQVLREKLARPISLPKGIDPNTPLRDALEFLSDMNDVPILLDTQAFRAAGLQGEAEQHPIGLPKINAMPFRLVLHTLLAKMEPSATFLVRQDHLVVVPRSLTRPASWRAENRHLVPVVDLGLDRRPLEVALREVAEQTGINVVLDTRVGEKGKVGVSATFSQAAVDTVVYLLADMADLKAVALDNVLYVTSKENAKTLMTDLNKSGLKDRFTGGDSAPGGEGR